MSGYKASTFREITENRRGDFFNRGCNERYFFSHKISYFPKCGPDGYKLAYRMCGESDPNKHWEVVLHAISPVVDEFPNELFFDDDLIWHQQQFGEIGQIATANLVLDGNKLHTMVHISDLVQRISRKREYKTRIENRFKGWPYMLLNSIINFALENNVKSICSPTADLAIEHTDPNRNVQKELFERVYDRAVNKLFRATKEGEWWAIDVEENRDRIIIPEKKQEMIGYGKTICICHDIERGLGHLDVDPNFADLANKTSQQNLDKMLIIEKAMNLKATYNVLGCFFDEVRERMEKEGHCIAFHSYDHSVSVDQLARCREVDYRIKGYRLPRSKITPDLSDENLCFHNFEWLASSAYSLGITLPEIQNRIVKMPILFDDFELYRSKMKYEEWERKAIEMIRQNDFVAFCLHDCYSHYWLPYYREFLNKISELGKFKTLNEAADEVILINSK
jgi:hypothetical protein